MWELDYKAECWRIDAFELWCWRRLLRVPWTARRSNKSILKEINPGCSLEKTPSWERLKAEREEGNRGWDGCMASLIEWTWTWLKSRRQWGTENLGVLQSMGLRRVGHDWTTITTVNRIWVEERNAQSFCFTSQELSLFNWEAEGMR